MPNLALARRFLDEHPPTGRVLMCAVSGAHMYGFPSPDSDLDLKGIHLAPARNLLGLHPELNPHDLTEEFDGVECDLTSNEAASALRLLIAGNGNMLERILSRYQLVDSSELRALQELARGAISRRFARHYSGFFRGCCQEHLRAPTVKTMLYGYRVALTGTHLLRTGSLEPDLSVLAPEYGFADVAELIVLKQAGTEHGPLDAALDERHRGRWVNLEQVLTDAEDRSRLPAEPPNRTEIDAWLVDTRLSEFTSEDSSG